MATVRIPHPVFTYIPPVLRGNTIYFVASSEGEVPYVVRGRLTPAR
ncbi:MAG: hypothetical protein HOP28_03535 [Gemmatimonadales bacterium]|nr:hypothetical protein [Gemmatimonadales bacterium]